MPRKKKVVETIVSKEVIKAYEDCGYRVLCFSVPGDEIQWIDVAFPNVGIRKKILQRGKRDLQAGWRYLVDTFGEVPPEAQPQQTSLF